MAETTHKPRPRKRFPEVIKDENLLSDALKAEIRNKAKEEILKAQRAEAAKEYLEKCKAEELALLEPAKEFVEITIDVPGFTKYLMVDGRTFAQGDRATVTRQEAASLLETMDRAWRHEKSNGGAHMKDYRPPIADGATQASSGYNKLMRM